MKTPAAPQTLPSADPLPAPRDRGAPLLDPDECDGLSTDAATANRLPAEQQLTRFLQWLQLTDRGHQPC